VTKIVEMDIRGSIFMQMEEDIGPVILIERIKVDPEESDLFIKGWATETEKFKKQPGFISTQLHKGIGGSSTAQWPLLIYSRKWLFQVSVLNDNLFLKVSVFAPGFKGLAEAFGNSSF
jgi:Antibiotic biosynthesis monooxygenase